jgi:hypothetical protein
METAIISVIRQMLLEGFAKHPPKLGTPVELVSSTVAWGSTGPRKNGGQSPKRMPVGRMSETIEKIIKPMLTSLG